MVQKNNIMNLRIITILLIGVSYCQAAKTSKSGNEVCQDSQEPMCQSPMAERLCSIPNHAIRAACPKTCGTCDVAVTGEGCRDKLPACQSPIAKTFCRFPNHAISKGCPKTCGKC
ncbi:uncharacterized protein LOC144658373 isoform X1 [Oculina patagonica]